MWGGEGGGKGRSPAAGRCRAAGSALSPPAFAALPSRPPARCPPTQLLFNDYARGAVAACVGGGATGADLLGLTVWVLWMDEPDADNGGAKGADRRAGLGSRV